LIQCLETFRTRIWWWSL